MASNLIKAAGDCGSGTTAQDMLDTLGEELFNKLRSHFGGTEMRLTPHPSNDHPLVKALGRRDAEFICEEFAGIQLYIPKSGNSYDARDAFICRALAEGIGRTEIARALDISTRQLRKHTTRLGLRGNCAEPSGLTIEEVAASIKADRVVVDLDRQIIEQFNFRRKESAFGAARKKFVLSASERVDREILDTLASTVRFRDRVFSRFLNGELDREQAQIISGFSHSQFRRLLKRFRETGTIVPPDQPYTTSPDASNGPLTHGLVSAGISLHSTNENRVHAL